jgi:hypothetical protein
MAVPKTTQAYGLRLLETPNSRRMTLSSLEYTYVTLSLRILKVFKICLQILNRYQFFCTFDIFKLSLHLFNFVPSEVIIGYNLPLFYITL